MAESRRPAVEPDAGESRPLSLRPAGGAVGPPSAAERRLSAVAMLYYDFAMPAAARGPAPLLIALHGYGGSKRQMMREAERLAPPAFAIAALQGIHQHLKEPRDPGGPLLYGFGWLTNFHTEESVAIHHRALLDLICSLTGEGSVDPARVFLLGFSQACALNYRFAFTYPERLRGVIGICGGLPGDWETSAAYRNGALSVLHLAGDRDEYYPPERVAGYGDRLGTRAAGVDFRSYDAGHEIVDAMRGDARQWLNERAR